MSPTVFWVEMGWETSFWVKNLKPWFFSQYSGWNLGKIRRCVVWSFFKKMKWMTWCYKKKEPMHGVLTKWVRRVGSACQAQQRLNFILSNNFYFILILFFFLFKTHNFFKKKPLDLNAKGLKNIIPAILKNSNNKFIK